MFLHEIKSPHGSRKRRKIVGRGRGSGHGKTSTKGQKGQKSRSGRGIIGQLEGGQMPLIRRLPKIGFRSKRPILYQVVNLDHLSRFKSGSVVDAKTLKSKGLIKNIYRPFKILGSGELKHALTVQAYSFSKSAADKIAKAGGKIETIDQNFLKQEQLKEQTSAKKK
jgi:large subunit ribosomal protein L15